MLPSRATDTSPPFTPPSPSLPSRIPGFKRRRTKPSERCVARCVQPCCHCARVLIHRSTMPPPPYLPSTPHLSLPRRQETCARGRLYSPPRPVILRPGPGGVPRLGRGLQPPSRPLPRALKIAALALGSQQPTPSRRPNAVGQGVSFKDSARSPTNTTKPGGMYSHAHYLAR